MGRLIDIAIRIAINGIAFVVAVMVIPGAEFRSEPWKIVLVAAIFGVVNAYLRPILRVLSLPLSLLTLGAVGFVINMAMVLLVGAISGNLRFGFRLADWPRTEFSIDALLVALGVAIVVSVVATVLSLVRMLVPRI